MPQEMRHLHQKLSLLAERTLKIQNILVISTHAYFTIYVGKDLSPLNISMSKKKVEVVGVDISCFLIDLEVNAL